MTQVLKHLKNSTIADGPDPNQINPSDWNAAHVFSAGALGGLLMRDTGDATYGASWLASVAAGSVLISNGVGAAPTWAASLTLGANLTIGGALIANGAVQHQINFSSSAILGLQIRNTLAGPAAGAYFQLGNDNNPALLNVVSYASTYTGAVGIGDRAGGTLFYHSGVGGLVLHAASGALEFWTNSAKRWTVDNAGALFAGVVAAGNSHTWLQQNGGAIQIGNAGTANVFCLNFMNANGGVGSVATSGSATAFNTASDARLKTDRGLARDTAVLERTAIHDYAWIADGTPARGVFAQDAHAIKPDANIPGTDERDEHGRLVRPWSTDYSKYVPDLIVGWQQHHARLAALERVIARG
jgi:hypothetical protein